MRVKVQTFAGQDSKRETGPGRIGFMSTQKRVSRSPRATGCCREARFRRQRMSCTERAGGRGSLAPPSIARFGCAVVGGLTASLLSILWSIRAWFLPSDEHLSPGAPERLATRFLQVDLPIGQRVRLVLTAERRVSPPPLGLHRPWLGALGVPTSPRSFPPPIPSPSGLTRLHWTLPQAPAADQRRAERYDGKRDLHFLHAA